VTSVWKKTLKIRSLVLIESYHQLLRSLFGEIHMTPNIVTQKRANKDYAFHGCDT
jgi:hypothetical protein